MGYACFMFAFYAYVQAITLFHFTKLLHWDDPKWMSERFEARQKASKRLYCLIQAVITLIAFFLDIVLAASFIQTSLGETNRLFGAAPFILIIAACSYLKALYLHALWLNWSIESLKERLKRRS